MNKKEAHEHMLKNATKAGIQFLNDSPPVDGWYKSDDLNMHFFISFN